MARPTVMAGLKCAPETWPTAYAMVSTVRPKASDTPSHWTFSLASTAVPQPPKTSQNVPKNSAARRCGLLCMRFPSGRAGRAGGGLVAAPVVPAVTDGCAARDDDEADHRP